MARVACSVATAALAEPLADGVAIAVRPDLVARHFTPAGKSPYDAVTWERRDVRIVGSDGAVVFEQAGVEVPSGWSANATSVLAKLYLRGRESGLRQMAERVVGTIAAWGVEDGYFDEATAQVFADELAYLIIHQRAAFNSPVWFNIGVAGVPQIASACYLLGIEDSLPSILNWYVEEGLIFQGGAGAGINLSALRGSSEPLSRGGTSSGPVTFMRGADASAGTIKSGGATRRAAKMVVLDVDHPDIEDFVWCKALEERKARALRAAGFDMGVAGKDSHSIQYQNANNSVCITDEFMAVVGAGSEWGLTSRSTGETLRAVSARGLFRQIAESAWECADPGVQFGTTINRWHTTPAQGPILSSNPCGEVFLPPNSSCNLASLNVLAFLGEDGRFDVEGLRAAVQVVFVAQDILAGRADYPTQRIAETARAYRPLGLGVTNLGALLMALGVPYDSDPGRAWAGAIAALLTGHAYVTSARIAQRLGPFASYAADRDAMLNVLSMHRSEIAGIDRGLTPSELVYAVGAAWDDAVGLAGRHGVRNSQATAIAPTGSISFLMGADTTGIEPAFSLVSTKALAGGGHMAMATPTVARSLITLGYNPAIRAEIEAHVAEHGTVVGAPGLDPAHYAVFAAAVGADAITPLGHVRMVAAVQPFVSGGISKSVNLPAEATVEDIEAVYRDAWRLGCKAISVYRDGCKVDQPLTALAPKTPAPASPPTRPAPPRRHLPARRTAQTRRVTLPGGLRTYVTVGEYEDGSPGEVFLRVAKQGSTLAGIMDALAVSVSLGLQHGVPLATFVTKYTRMRFEPAGMTDDPELRITSSLVDYIFRRLAVDYLSAEERADLGVFTSEERTVGEPALSHGVFSEDQPPVTSPVRAGDAPYCLECGIEMRRAGSCHACPACGVTSGCS